MSSLRVVTTAQALRTLCRRQSRCSPQRSTAIRPLTRPVRSRPTLLLPLSSSPSWFGSYASDAPRPVQRQNATLPSRLFSAVVAKTDSVRQTRFPNALPINRQRDLRGPAALPREIDPVARRALRWSRRDAFDARGGNGSGQLRTRYDEGASCRGRYQPLRAAGRDWVIRALLWFEWLGSAGPAAAVRPLPRLSPRSQAGSPCR